MTLILGKKTSYPDLVDSSLLYPIERSNYRENILPVKEKIYGYDRWNSYEFSYLDKETGWPVQGHLELLFPHESIAIIESKSLKIYLGSYANSLFETKECLTRLQQDIEALIQSPLSVHFTPLQRFSENLIKEEFPDDIEGLTVLEKDFWCRFDAFKSLCPVTASPDFATLLLRGTVAENTSIDAQTIRAHLYSYASKQEFHEHCIETIFSELLTTHPLENLTLEGLFTRRGSLDINPLRSTLPQVRTPKKRARFQ